MENCRFELIFCLQYQIKRQFEVCSAVYWESGHCPTCEAMLSIRVLAVIHEVRSAETTVTRTVTDYTSLPV